MKKLTLLLTIALSLPALAKQQSPIDALCYALSDFAGVAMDMRQSGAKYSTLIYMIHEQDDDQVIDIMEVIAERAYDQEIVGSNFSKIAIKSAFSKEIQNDCYNTFSY